MELGCQILLGHFGPVYLLQISKKEVIEMAEALGLETAHKPPSPCLSSRIPYGTVVSNERLKQVEQAEYHLNKFGFFGFDVLTCA